MVWLFLSLAAPLLWAVSNLVDGQLVRVRVKDPLTILSLIGIFSAAPAVVMFLVSRPFVAVPLPIIGMSVLTGIISLFSYYPYLRVLKTEHPASAVLLWNMSPVFVVVLAGVFLHEHLDVEQFIAIALLIASAVTASPLLGNADADVRSAKTRLARRSVFLMVIASILTATEALLLKGLFVSAPTDTVMCIVFASSAVSGAVILLFSSAVRNRTRILFSSSGWMLVAMNELLNQGGLVATQFAISMGSVSLTKVMGGLQPLFVIGFAVLLRRMFRAARIKMTNAPSLYRVIIATVFAIIGLALVRM